MSTENGASNSQPPQSAQPPADTTEAPNDVAVDGEVSAEAATEPESMAVDAPVPETTEEAAAPELMESRIPVKKDETLREFLNKMDDYSPIIPDAVTNYYLTLAGLPPPPQTSPHLARLIALAAQKFVSDIAADAYQYARIRSSNTSSNNPMAGLGAAGAIGGGPQGAAGAGAGAAAKDGAAGKQANLGAPRPGYGGGGQGGGQGRTVLTMEDLGMAVGEYGINVKRGEFYR